MRSISQLRVGREGAGWGFNLICYYSTRQCVRVCGFSRETEEECGEREGTKIALVQ